MNTLTSNYTLKHSPIPTAILNRELKIIDYSDTFTIHFAEKKDLKGKEILRVIEELPPQLHTDLRKSLQGTTAIQNDNHKFFLKTNKPKWLKWNINPWRGNEGTIDGIILVLEDVSDFMREQELLLKAEKVSKTGSWELNLITNEIYWSPMTKLMHEVPLDFLPVLEEGLNFFKEGDSRDRIALSVSNAIADGKPYDEELVLITAKGNEVWVRAKGEPEMVHGKCVRLFGTIQDIDKEKKAELKYLETSERLKIATAAANIGIWELYLEENLVICNDNMYEIYGITKDSSNILEDWLQRIHPEDLTIVQNALKKTINNQSPFNIQFRAIKPNKDIVFVLAKAKPQMDDKGNVKKIIGSNWDITELKTIQSELIQSETSLSSAFDHSAIGMSFADLTGRWTKVNDSLCNSVGYSHEELLSFTFKDITHPEDLDLDIRLHQELIDGKRDSYELQKRYIHKNGSLVDVILVVTAVRNEQGEILRFISQVLDITSRIEIEKRLNTLVEVTKEQNESLLNFAHIVSHNLRSHSTNMTMLTKFLAQEKEEVERQNLVGMLIDASDGLSETIYHLNDVVQAKTGALEKMQSVNLLKTLESIEKNIEVLLLEKNVIPIVDVAPTHFVMGVPAYIESIFFNLYTNALRYSSPNRKLEIKIKSQAVDDFLTISFADNGLGIDLERFGNKIFGMYKTFHENKDAKGIGLFITKNQVVSMGGTIEVESSPDMGATFIITLKKA